MTHVSPPYLKLLYQNLEVSKENAIFATNNSKYFHF